MKKYLMVLGLLTPPWAVFILACYWYFIDVAPPMVHTSVLVKDENGVPNFRVQRGHPVVILRNSCVTDTGKAFYTRILVARGSSEIYFLPSGEVQLTPGCHSGFNEVTIPAYVKPGYYDYVVTVVFENNPLVSTRMVLPIPVIEVLP